jgi:hypothetical protein
MTTFTEHFDGKVIVPDQTLRLRTDQRLIVHVEPEDVGTPGESLRKYAGTIGKEDADQMQKAIEEGCEQVNPDEW